MPGSTSEQRAQHLSRIRDNQRRSRARRKEYLQELETKYRECEQAGIQASAEVQQAAKKVLEENRRLRAILRQQGYTDSQIDTMPLDVGDLPSNAGRGIVLESVLSRRKRCLSQSPPQGASYGPTTPSSATSSTASLHNSYTQYDTPATGQQLPSPASTASLPHPNGVASCSTTLRSERPSALATDYRMTSDDVAWLQEQYRRVQDHSFPTTASMSSGMPYYSTTDNMRPMHPHLSADIVDGFQQMTNPGIIYR